MKFENVRGSIVAMITPFHEDGSVNFEALTHLIERQIAGGTSAILTLGTTGEYSTMTHEEDAAVVRHTIDTVAGRVPVIVGSGSNCTATQIEMSRRYEAMDAIRASGLELTDNMEQILSGAVKTVRENELYTPTAFAGGNAVRKILEYSMGDQASADRDTVLERIAAGQSAEAATAEFLTDDYFEAWYQATLAQLQQYEG